MCILEKVLCVFKLKAIEEAETDDEVNYYTRKNRAGSGGGYMESGWVLAIMTFLSPLLEDLLNHSSIKFSIIPSVLIHHSFMSRFCS